MPPENVPVERATPRIVTGPVGAELLDGEVGAEVVRDRVEAAGVHDPGAARLGGRVVGDVHPVHELGLAGEVDVVGAGRGARGDQRLAELLVGPDGRDHDPGPAGHRRPARPRRRRPPVISSRSASAGVDRRPAGSGPP